MSPVGKMVSELEINVAADKFYKAFKHEAFNLPTISPKTIQKVEVHERDCDNVHGHGSILIWNYTTLDGKAETFKERVEFDEEKLAIMKIGLEGNLFEHYKTFNKNFQVVPKGVEQCLVVWTLEYEKLDDDSIYPSKYLDVMNIMTKDIESHLK